MKIIKIISEWKKRTPSGRTMCKDGTPGYPPPRGGRMVEAIVSIDGYLCTRHIAISENR